jgi:hypothetical protein
MQEPRAASAAALDEFDRQYREMFGEPAAKSTDKHDLSQPDPRVVVETVTTYGAHEKPVIESYSAG